MNFPNISSGMMVALFLIASLLNACSAQQCTSCHTSPRDSSNLFLGPPPGPSVDPLNVAITGTQGISYASTAAKMALKVPALAPYLPATVSTALKSTPANFIGAVPNALTLIRDFRDLSNASPEDRRRAEGRVYVSGGKLTESLGLGALASTPGLGAVGSGVTVGNLVYGKLLARGNDPRSLGEMGGMLAAINAANKGNTYTTLGQIGWEMAHDSRAKESPTSVHGIAGRASQSIGQLGLIADWGLNKLFGREDQSQLAIQAREAAEREKAKTTADSKAKRDAVGAVCTSCHSTRGAGSGSRGSRTLEDLRGMYKNAPVPNQGRRGGMSPLQGVNRKESQGVSHKVEVMPKEPWWKRSWKTASSMAKRSYDRAKAKFTNAKANIRGQEQRY